MNVNHTQQGSVTKGIEVAEVFLELPFVPRIKVWRRSSDCFLAFKSYVPLTWRVRAGSLCWI